MTKVGIKSGFSLVEMLVVVAMIGILAVLAYPSYFAQIQKTRRADAKIGLIQLAQQLERCYTEFNAYNSVNCALAAGGTVNTMSASRHYTIRSQDEGGVEFLTATGFTLFAIPNPNDPNPTQLTDTCSTGGNFFSLDNLGNKRPRPEDLPGCWE